MTIYPAQVNNSYWVQPKGQFIAQSIGYGAVTLVNLSTNTLYFAPFYLDKQCLVWGAGLDVTTATTSMIRMGLYSNVSSKPSALIVDGGEISGSSTGFRRVSLSLDLKPGWYWSAAAVQITSGTLTVRGPNAPLPFLGYSSGTDTSAHCGFSESYTYGALPATASNLSIISGTSPSILVQV